MRFNGGAKYKAFSRRSRWPVIVATAVSTVLLVVSGFFAWKYFSNSGDEESADDVTSQRIVEKVNNLYLAPPGEEPTVAQIKDIDKLQDQPFFDPAQNGDYLLVYSDSQIAMVYREDVNKIVTAGPISTGTDENVDNLQGQGDVMQ